MSADSGTNKAAGYLELRDEIAMLFRAHADVLTDERVRRPLMEAHQAADIRYQDAKKS